jgi:hypothetical protein
MPRSGKLPSEKTLEINYVRNYEHRHHLVWQGATLREEKYGGWDVKLDNLVPGRSFILQFKRPYCVRRKNNGKIFVFEINNNKNNDQNFALSVMARHFGPRSVFYAFPCVEDIRELEKPREAIISKTELVDIYQVNFAKLGFVKHKVELFWDNAQNRVTSMRIFSDPLNVDFMTEEDYNQEWGFNLHRFKEALKDHDMEKVKSKRLAVKFFTYI